MRRAVRILRRTLEPVRSTSLIGWGQTEPPGSGITTTQRAEVDAAVIAYVQWRAACTAVSDAYRSWAQATPADTELAYCAYRAALDREQTAAEVYARLMTGVGHLVESGLDYPLNARFSVADTD